MDNIFAQTEIPIEIKKGSTLTIPITYKDSQGVPIDLTGYKAKLQVRSTARSEDPADIELTEEDGISLGGENGTIVVVFLSALTLALVDGYSGTWDLFLIPTEASAFCLLQGSFEVVASTTKV